MSGRVVLVTGGSRGIGLACARAFEAAGDRVAVTYRSKPVDDLWCLRCDQRSTEEVDATFAAIEERWGPVEVLVANAGMTRDGLAVRMSDEAWDEVVDTNLTGTFRVTRRAIRPMLRARGGRIVLVSSIGGFAGQAGQANYAASKAGLHGLARTLANELASRSITVNVVAPGAVRTDMTAAMSAEWAARVDASVPLGRMAEPEEIAAAVLFLASPSASYITGALLPVDGGLGMGH